MIKYHLTYPKLRIASEEQCMTKCGHFLWDMLVLLVGFHGMVSVCYDISYQSVDLVEGAALEVVLKVLG